MQTDLSRRIPAFDEIAAAAHEKAVAAIQQTGRALPCSVVAVSGSIVTVKFEVHSPYNIPQVKVPVATSTYERVPVQVGDKGVTIAVDAYIGGVTGLGGGTAVLGNRGNLTTLVYLPVGNTGWSQVDPNLFVLQGPNGVLLQDLAADVTLLLSKQNGLVANVGNLPVSIKGGGCSMTMQSGTLALTGTLTINGQPYLAHTHGNGNSGNPTTGVIS